MLDLTLQHLDIDVGEAGEEEVDVVVRACGESKCSSVAPCLLGLTEARQR